MNPAYEHNGANCARAAFYAIACDPGRSVAVEACAGAGKTWMLVSRILRALLAGSQPHEILAITFTKKAAGEMRQRLQQWLADFSRPRPADPAQGGMAESHEAWQQRLLQQLISRGIDPESAPSLREPLQNLYQSLLDHGRPVQIRTFHSWFAALLRSAPLAVLQQLGLPSAYELLEDDADAVAEVWRRYLRRVAGEPALAEDYAALVAEMGRHGTQRALEGALARRVEFLLADEAGHVDEAVAPFDVHYPRLAGVARPRDWLLQRAAGRELLQAAARALAPMAPTFAAKGAELLTALQAADWDGVVAALCTQQKKPRVFGKSHDDVRAAQNEVEAVLAAERQHAARQYHQRLARLTRPLIDCFGALKRERGWVDMSDIERAALVLLSDPVLSGWVQERLDARVRHLLIDEFQDTNPLQWQALHAWLSGYAGAGGGQGAPSVFIVGDPKQSIYRFRRADPRVFAAAQDFIVHALGGDRLACDHTHRNAPALLGGVNAVMGAAQAAAQFEGYRAHTTESDALGSIELLPLIPRPPRAAAGGDDAEPEWRDSLSTPREEPEESLRLHECRQAARWIAGRIGAGVAPAQLMVLARKREPLGLLQQQLRQLGVPCEQPEQLVLGQQPAVQDVLALVDALVSPGHDLALARALKSPLFGLGDADLAALALAARAAADGLGGRPAWLDVLSNVELSTQDAKALAADLARYREWLLGLPPHDALQAIYDHGDVLARFGAAAPPAERAHVQAQLRALLAAALRVQGGRYLTAYQWLRALRRQRLPVPRHAAPAAVQLLTVHGAKGLEADEVLLLDAASGAPRGGGPGVLIDWPGDAPAPRRLVFVASEGAPPPSLTELAESEGRAQAREELNALYVAMTRARRRLVLSGFAPHAQPSGSWWQRIEALAAPLPAPGEPPAPPATGEAGFSMLELPQVGVDIAQPAIEAGAIEAAGEALPSAASRLGEAMHWLLEHAADTPHGWLPQRLVQARRRFGVAAVEGQRAAALARRILAGEGAWAWQAEQVAEAFDEIELTHQGQRLRIDRLVRRRATDAEPESWWVLDYKSAAQPERDPTLLAQLARYRLAVQALYPGAPVQAALLAADGRLVRVD